MRPVTVEPKLLSFKILLMWYLRKKVLLYIPMVLCMWSQVGS